MANLSEDIQCAGSDTRPSMLDRTDFASWKQRIRLYFRGKENGVNIPKSIDEGPFRIGTLRETLTEKTECALHLGPERPRVYSDLTSEKKDRMSRVDRIEDRQTMHGVQVQLVMGELRTELEYFNDKMLLMQAQENGVALDEEQLLFIAADDCDAFDSDVDEAPTAQPLFMANLSSVYPVYDKAGLSYDLDVLSEVHDHDHYQDVVCEHHEVQEMHDDVQPNYVVDSHTDYTSDSNMIPYANNREVHLNYLNHLKESVATLHEIVNEAKVERPLDISVASACLYTKHSQELLEYVIDTCCSKHMTGDRSRLKNFMKKFIEIIRFGNDHFGAIIEYRDYVIGDSMISGNGVVERRNRTLVEAVRTMLIFSKASMFLWAEVVATACYTQNRSLSHTRHNKIPYELVYNKKHDLTFLRVFGALCYPTNDNEDLEKLQPTANIGIFVGYAPSRKGYRIYNKEPDISSGLVPNLVPAAPYVPSTNKELEILFQPMFDEYMKPPRVDRPVSHAPAVPVSVNSAGSPSSTSIDQDHSGPGPQLLTPGTISSGLVPQPLSPTPNVPPIKNDWDTLFCPMFDEYFNPLPSVAQPVLVAAIQEPVVSTSTPS
nr:hypothetical protein [Tanacetum cinerariifolium]